MSTETYDYDPHDVEIRRVYQAITNGAREKKIRFTQLQDLIHYHTEKLAQYRKELQKLREDS